MKVIITEGPLVEKNIQEAYKLICNYYIKTQKNDSKK